MKLLDQLNVAIISLGCEKNLVDSESILGFIDKDNVRIVDDLESANLIIVNTCGFITSAKVEAINTIYEALTYKPNALIVVCGCLVERYYDDLVKGITDVDLWVPIREYPNFGDLLAGLVNDNYYIAKKPDERKRKISTPPHLAYVRISDGCNNRCAYCAIPLIRGNFRSRKEEDILEEVRALIKEGRKEICLISQDLTRYGSDLDNMTLAKLLKDIVKIEGVYVIRLLYLYPDEITDELIDVVRDENKILPYFDIPIQHASNKLLKLMNRRGTKEDIRSLINKIRNKVKDAVIRTTIIIGFPHESNHDQKELIDFVKEIKFDHLGAFTYSREEDTPSYNMTMQVSKRKKEERYNELLELQKYISLKQNERYLNKVYPCVIEGYDEESGMYTGRGYMMAPDDIDGAVYINSTEELFIGDIVNVVIKEVDFYDLIGEVVK